MDGERQASGWAADAWQAAEARESRTLEPDWKAVGVEPAPKLIHPDFAPQRTQKAPRIFPGNEFRAFYSLRRLLCGLFAFFREGPFRLGETRICPGQTSPPDCHCGREAAGPPGGPARARSTRSPC